MASIEMKTIWLLYGLPASGKSTWTKEMLKTNERIQRVNKDTLREMLNLSKRTKGSEKFVIGIRDQIIIKSLQSGNSIIVDDTNFPFGGKHFLRICEIAKLIGDVQVIEKYFDVTLEECLFRNKNSDRIQVPDETIYRMFNKHVKDKLKNYELKQLYFPKIELFKYDKNLPNAVIFDIDGTLANNNGKRGFFEWNKVESDDVNYEIKHLHNFINNNDNNTSILIVSGRDQSCESETRRWLAINDINYHYLFMRKANDMRKDSVIKQEIYDTQIKGKYNVLFVVDDRDQVVEMWRRNGLTCLQCNYGNF